MPTAKKKVNNEADFNKLEIKSLFLDCVNGLLVLQLVVQERAGASWEGMD